MTKPRLARSPSIQLADMQPQNCGAVPQTSVQDQGAARMIEDYYDFPTGSDFRAIGQSTDADRDRGRKLALRNKTAQGGNMLLTDSSIFQMDAVGQSFSLPEFGRVQRHIFSMQLGQPQQPSPASAERRRYQARNSRYATTYSYAV